MKNGYWCFGVCYLIAICLAENSRAAVLLGDWQLNNNYLDSSGNNLNGTLLGSGVTGTTDRFGNANSALHFSGNGYIRINDPGIMSVPSYSISLWFTWDAPFLGTGGVDFLTAKANENFEIHTGGGGGVNGIRFIPSGGHYNDNPNVIHAGWNNLVVTFDNATDTSKVYMDGALVGSRVQGTGGDTGGPFFIGARSNGSLRFHGKIDDVKLFSGALTQSEVGTLFSGAPAVVPEPTSFVIMALGALAMGTNRSRRSSGRKL